MSHANETLCRDDLIVSYGTLTGAEAMKPARHSFAQRVAAAAAAGFAAIGWDPNDYDGCRAAGLSNRDLCAILNDNGVSAAELEFVPDWAHGGDRGKAARQTEDRMYAMADLFGARHMNIGEMGPLAEMDPLEVVAERFAAVCDRAAAHGLMVALEFLPWTGIPDPKAAWEICHLAGRRNGGLLIDTWHYFHSGGDAEELRKVPADHIVAIQLDDADKISSNDMLYNTLRRRPPGEGIFDLLAFIRLLDEIGVQAPISVEIISPDMQTLTPEEAARIAHDTSCEVIARARDKLRNL